MTAAGGTDRHEPTTVRSNGPRDDYAVWREDTPGCFDDDVRRSSGVSAQQQRPQDVRPRGGRSDALLHHHSPALSRRSADATLATRLAQLVKHRLAVTGVVPHAHPLDIGPHQIPVDACAVPVRRLDVKTNAVVRVRPSLGASHSSSIYLVVSRCLVETIAPPIWTGRYGQGRTSSPILRMCSTTMETPIHTFRSLRSSANGSPISPRGIPCRVRPTSRRSSGSPGRLPGGQSMFFAKRGSSTRSRARAPLSAHRTRHRASSAKSRSISR